MLLHLKLRDNPIWKRTIVNGGLCLFLVFSQIMSVWAAEAIGSIKGITGESSHFKLIGYDGKLGVVSVNRTVYAGDKITVKVQQSEIKVLLKGKQDITTFAYNDGKPHTFAAPSCERWFCDFGTWVSDLLEKSPSERLSAISKSSKLKISVLEDDVTKYFLEEVGKDEVYFFAWRGGQSSYTVRIHEDGNPANKKQWVCSKDKETGPLLEVIKSEKGANLYRIAVKQDDSSQGFKLEKDATYRLSIFAGKDNKSKEERVFKIVSKSEMPLEDLLKDEQWQFAAYQRVARKTSDMDQMIRMGMEVGSLPVTR